MVDPAGETSEAPTRQEGLAEVLLLGAVVLAPWPYGCAGEVARYALSSILLAACGFWALGCALRPRGRPELALPCAAVASLPLLQLITRTSAAPVWTAEAFLVSTAMMGATAFWSERARDRQAAYRLALTILAACAVQGVFGAAQWSAGSNHIYGVANTLVSTPFGSFVNHNHYAGLLEMGVLLALGLTLGFFRRGGRVVPRVVAFGGLALGLGAVHLASRSRGGLLALVGGGVFLVLLHVSEGPPGAALRRRLALGGAGIALLVGFGLAVIPEATRDHLGTVFHGPVDVSGEYRLDIARATVRLAMTHPWIGSGVGAYGDAVPAFKRSHGYERVTHAESDVLEAWAEGGLVGVLVLAWLAWTVVRGLRTRLGPGRDPLRKGMVVGGAAALAALLIHSLFDFNLRIPSNALVFASLLGLAASPRSKSPAGGGRMVAGIAALVFFGLALTAAWRAAGTVLLEQAQKQADPGSRAARLGHLLEWHPYLAEAQLDRGLALRDLALGAPGFREARLTGAERALRQAVFLRPLWGEAWAELGWVLALRGDWTAAEDALGRAVGLDPTNVGVSLARAEFLARRGRSSDAIEELRRLRRSDAGLGLEWTLSVAMRFTHARSELERLTDGSPAEQSIFAKVVGQ